MRQDGRSAICPSGPKQSRVMWIGRAALIAVAAVVAVLAQNAGCLAQAPPAAPAAQQAGPVEKFDTTIQFSFALEDLLTNQQFPGQHNSFYVTYEYTGTLKGAVPGPAAHSVATDTFPYFESIRNDMKEYILSYPNKDEFYELLGSKHRASPPGEISAAQVDRDCHPHTRFPTGQHRSKRTDSDDAQRMTDRGGRWRERGGARPARPHVPHGAVDRSPEPIAEHQGGAARVPRATRRWS